MWEADVRGFSSVQREFSFQTMSSSTTILLASALSIGFFHTLLGPDHYLPFVAMARVGSWSKKKTLFITALCGVGHIVGSVVLGMVGFGLGFSLSRLEGFEASRGAWAAWALIGFGLLYTVWGIRRAARGHSHSHGKGHLHPHTLEAGSRMTPWVLFVIFLLGPCEALIPLLMFPAATESWRALFLVTGAFGIATLATMLGLVFLSLEGIQRLPFPNIGRYAHAAAGLTILLCGVAIQFLGI